jgi:hypothetical protein
MQCAGVAAAVVLAAFAGANAAGTDADGQDLKLWYRQPAKQWTEALPVGNGRLGAMIFGGVAGIAEMFLQSHAGEIHVLPALPAAWPRGSVIGLCARGGFEVDIHWRDGRLDNGLIRSKTGGKCRVRSATPVRVSLAGAPVRTSSPTESVIEFETRAGRSYVLDAPDSI